MEDQARGEDLLDEIETLKEEIKDLREQNYLLQNENRHLRHVCKAWLDAKHAVGGY
jgi:regulator of replication initiation timing